MFSRETSCFGEVSEVVTSSQSNCVTRAELQLLLALPIPACVSAGPDPMGLKLSAVV